MGSRTSVGISKGGFPCRLLDLDGKLVPTKEIIHKTITMKQTTTIDFTQNVTTSEAFKYIGRLTAVIVRNIIRAIDKAAHRWPWAFIFSILLVSIITSYVCIGQARAERDSYNKEAAHLQALVNSYRAGDKEVQP